ncbi:hypothetical protein [Streptomyces sp. NBC_01538]|uniref:hypothetical protein n=1 Tax=Streptomyces sp. NBC_01538 TaxID=2903897 RepID=UPI00386E331E
MPVEVPVRQIQPWAVMPSKYTVDRQRSGSDAAVYRDNFRFVLGGQSVSRSSG